MEQTLNDVKITSFVKTCKIRKTGFTLESCGVFCFLNYHNQREPKEAKRLIWGRGGEEIQPFRNGVARIKAKLQAMG